MGNKKHVSVALTFFVSTQSIILGEKKLPQNNPKIYQNIILCTLQERYIARYICRNS
jgi:hypothetical protein